MYRRTAPGLRRIEYLLVLSVVVFAALLAAAAAYAGGTQVWAAVLRLGPWTIAAALGLSLVNYGLRTVRWHLYSRQLGLGLPWYSSALYYVAGFALTTTPGKVGEALRVWLMERCHGYSYVRTVPLLVADRVSDLVGIGLLTLLGLGSLAMQPWIAVAAAVIAAAVLLVGLRPGLSLGLVASAYRMVGRGGRLFARLRRAVRSTLQLFAPRIFLVSTVLAVAGWVAEGLAFAMVLHALGADVGTAQAVVIFAAAMIVGGLTMLPGGLGGTEAAMVVLLAALDVPLDLAVAGTAVIRLTTLWFAVGLGFLVLPLALRRARRALARSAGAEPATA